MNQRTSPTVAAIILGWTLFHALNAEHLKAKPESDASDNQEQAEVELVRDPEEALRILEETGRWLEQVAELENDPPGRQTEESQAIRIRVRRALGRIDLENIEFPDGVLLSDEELIERAIAHGLSLFGDADPPDLRNPPPELEYRGGLRVVRFPSERGVGRRENRFQIYIHPLTGHVYALLIE